MREKRKRGSTLITVLAVSLIFMALSGVILKSISSTMKSNINQKEREDLRYAAESGLEIARSHIEEKGVINQDVISEINLRLNKILVDTNNDSLPDGNIGKVEVISPKFNSSGNIKDGQITINGEIKKYNIKVRAEKKDSNNIYQEIGVNYKELESNLNSDNIFQHSIVAGNGEINIWNCNKSNCNDECENKNSHCIHCNGHTNIEYNSGSISSSQGTSINGDKKSPELDSNIKENTYQEIQFINKTKEEEIIYMVASGGFDTFKELNKVEFLDSDKKKIKPIFIKMDLKDSNNIEIDGQKMALDDFKNIEKNAVMLVEFIDKEKVISDTPLRILMTNAKKVEMKLGNGASTLKNDIWMNKGKINITGEGAIHLAFATIFSSELNYSTKMSINISYPSADKLYGFIKNSDKLDELIKNIIPNWNSSGNSNGNSSESGYIRFEDKTFSN